MHSSSTVEEPSSIVQQDDRAQQIFSSNGCGGSSTTHKLKYVNSEKSSVHGKEALRSPRSLLASKHQQGADSGAAQGSLQQSGTAVTQK